MLKTALFTILSAASVLALTGCEGHQAKVGEALVAVDPLAQAHLPDGREAVFLQQVDQQPGLHPIPAEEGQALQHLAAPVVNACEPLVVIVPPPASI